MPLCTMMNRKASLIFVMQQRKFVIFEEGEVEVVAQMNEPNVVIQSYIVNHHIAMKPCNGTMVEQ